MTDLDGNTSGQTGQTNNQNTDSEAARIADLNSQVARYQNDWQRFAEKLHEKNYHLRQRAQDAEAQLPKDGQVIVSADDAKLLAEYKKLGTPKEIVDQNSKLVQLERFKMVSKAASVAEMNPNVLNKLLPDNAVLEVGEATDENGQAKRTVNIIQEGSDPIELGTYAQNHWSDFMPALKSEQQSQEPGQTWIQQTSSTKGASTSTQNGMNPLLKSKLEEAKARAKAPEGKSFVR